MPLFDEMYAPEGFDEEGEFMPLITIEEEDEASIKDPYPNVLPVLALKNTVLFPGVVIPITVGRDKSIRAVQKAYDQHRIVAVLSQRDSKVENPSADDLFQIGTLARIIKLIRMPDGTTTAILQGRKRFRLLKMVSENPYMQGTVEELGYKIPKEKLEFEAIVASITDKARQIIQLSPHIPSEAVIMIKNINNPSFLINFIASNLGVKLIAKQSILEKHDLGEKAEALLEQMDTELQLLELKDRIESKVRTDIEKQQRDYYLSQQLKTIQEELGGNPQEEELRTLVERARKKKWSKTVAETFDKEINKLRRMNPQVAEYAIQMNYLDILLELPWEEYTKDNFDLKKVKNVLDKDHYGLEKVKERILQHLADACPAPLFRKFKEKYPDHIVVSYVNTTAEMKTLTDICCTSTNAVQIIESIPKDQPIIFAPDINLGKYLVKKTGRDMVLWNGTCMVHEIFSAEKITKLRMRHPNALFIAHPECEPHILEKADFIGSTTGLLNFTIKNPATEFIVATEAGIIHQMEKRSPHKTFIPAPPNNTCACNECPHMKRNTLEKLYVCMKYEKPEIILPDWVIEQGVKSIDRMLEISARAGL